MIRRFTAAERAKYRRSRHREYMLAQRGASRKEQQRIAEAFNSLDTFKPAFVAPGEINQIFWEASRLPAQSSMRAGIE